MRSAITIMLATLLLLLTPNARGQEFNSIQQLFAVYENGDRERALTYVEGWLEGMWYGLGAIRGGGVPSVVLESLTENQVRCFMWVEPEDMLLWAKALLRAGELENIDYSSIVLWHAFLTFGSGSNCPYVVSETD